MELPDKIYEQVQSLSEQGNDLCDEGEFSGAIGKWRDALALLPSPQHEWEAAMWLCASIGDACYQQGDYPSAKDALLDALNGPDGQSNPFVHYMLGKTMVRLGDDERAIDELLRAYMLDGVDIFDSDEEEGPDSLQLLEDRGLIDEE